MHFSFMLLTTTTYYRTATYTPLHLHHTCLHTTYLRHTFSPTLPCRAPAYPWVLNLCNLHAPTLTPRDVCLLDAAVVPPARQPHYTAHCRRAYITRDAPRTLRNATVPDATPYHEFPTTTPPTCLFALRASFPPVSGIFYAA